MTRITVQKHDIVERDLKEVYSRKYFIAYLSAAITENILWFMNHKKGNKKGNNISVKKEKRK